MIRFHYETLTQEERVLLKSYGQLSDEECWRRADERDPIAWLEWEARWAAKHEAWAAGDRRGQEPQLRYPAWVKLALASRRSPRTKNWREKRGTLAYPSDIELARAAVEAQSQAYWRGQKGNL